MTVIRSTVADVDLDAIVGNLATVTPAGQRAIAVVKADAYGHGAEAVGAALVEAGAAMLAVFTVDEGIVLRRAGIAAPILVFVGVTDPSEAAAAVDHRLTMVVWDEERARALSDAAKAADATVTVHVKVDTGLMRLGAPLDEAVRRYRAIRDLPRVHIEGVFTHYANSDLPEDTYTSEQYRRFAAVVAALPERPAFVHAAASAGIVAAGAGDVCDAVRPGVALYGLHPAPHLATIPLRPALRWSSRIQRLARASAGTGVGYGHEFRLPREGVVATVPVGYGDGLARAARHRGHALVRGRTLPFAGRIAMDQFHLDVTGVDGVREGDEVVLIGSQDGAAISAEDLADASGTINYEVVTNIRPRVARRYLRGGRVVATRTLGEGLVRR